MKTKRIFNSLIAAAIALVLLSTACSKSNPKPNAPTPVAVTGVVLTTDAKFGNIHRRTRTCHALVIVVYAIKPHQLRV